MAQADVNQQYNAHGNYPPLIDCKIHCEATPGCVAVDHAALGDRRCYLFSACPNPNPVNSQSVNRAHYLGHRTWCAENPCSATNAPAAGVATLLNAGITPCLASITNIVSPVVNTYELTLTHAGNCPTVTSAACKDDIAALATTAANVNAWQTSVAVNSCSGTSATATVTFVNPQQGLSGDPFVSFNGKQTQMWLPVGRPHFIMKCADLDIFGRVIDNGAAGNQWFDMFKINAKGEEIISVGVKNQSASFFMQAGVGTQKVKADDISSDQAAMASARVGRLLNKLRNADSATIASKNLTTITVDVMSRQQLTTGGPITTGSKVRIDQDSTHTIGRGFSESVMVETGAVALKMSSIEHKNAAGDAIAVHLDLEFLRLDAHVCEGPLAEIWGIRPLSKATAKLLVPAKKQ